VRRASKAPGKPGPTSATARSHRLSVESDCLKASGGGVGKAVAPEPASWALMLLDVGGLGGTLRRRRALSAM